MAEEGRTVIERHERKETIVAWIVIVVLVSSMFVRALVSIGLYGLHNRPRHWQYRTTPYIPAQAYSSTRPASSSTEVPKQVPLPPEKGKKMVK